MRLRLRARAPLTGKISAWLEIFPGKKPWRWHTELGKPQSHDPQKHQCHDHKNTNAYTQKHQCHDHKNTNACARKPHCLHTRCGRGPVPTHVSFRGPRLAPAPGLPASLRPSLQCRPTAEPAANVSRADVALAWRRTRPRSETAAKPLRRSATREETEAVSDR
jgi:hypothetical protein